jgi:hypothetical protein
MLWNYLQRIGRCLSILIARKYSGYSETSYIRDREAPFTFLVIWMWKIRSENIKMTQVWRLTSWGKIRKD